MFQGKPIIGLSGGIGAGKTFVSDLFAELGCLVINSDALVRRVYQERETGSVLRDWWGDAILAPDGRVDRSAVARKIFESEDDRRRLEGFLHPRVAQLRMAQMEAGAANRQIKAFVWDSPLLFETKLSAECDATVFVDASLPVRLARVRETRGWDDAELSRRENSQMPLDKKRRISDYVVVNTTNAESTRVQVRELLSRILAGKPSRPHEGQVKPD